MRRALEMELKPWVLAPGLTLILCVFEPCMFCGWQGRPFVTLVTVLGHRLFPGLLRAQTWLPLGRGSLPLMIYMSQSIKDLDQKWSSFCSSDHVRCPFLAVLLPSLPPVTPNQLHTHCQDH